MGMDELIDLFAEGDELVSNTAFEDLDLAYDVANGATFDGVVFRSCEFDSLDVSRRGVSRLPLYPLQHGRLLAQPLRLR